MARKHNLDDFDDDPNLLQRVWALKTPITAVLALAVLGYIVTDGIAWGGKGYRALCASLPSSLADHISCPKSLVVQSPDSVPRLEPVANASPPAAPVPYWRERQDFEAAVRAGDQRYLAYLRKADFRILPKDICLLAHLVAESSTDIADDAITVLLASLDQRISCAIYGGVAGSFSSDFQLDRYLLEGAFRSDGQCLAVDRSEKEPTSNRLALLRAINQKFGASEQFLEGSKFYLQLLSRVDAATSEEFQQACIGHLAGSFIVGQRRPDLMPLLGFANACIPTTERSVGSQYDMMVHTNGDASAKDWLLATARADCRNALANRKRFNSARMKPLLSIAPKR